MPPLTAAAVSANAFEETLSKLWLEWLSRYFDGGSHVVGGETLAFPQAQIRIQGRPIDQPLNGVSIMATWAAPSIVFRMWDGTKPQQWMHAKMSFAFWLRAAGSFADGTNARWQAQRLGDRLFAVLVNSAETIDLSAKGIHTVRAKPARLVANGPEAVGADKSAEYEMRLINVSATVRYEVVSQ